MDALGDSESAATGLTGSESLAKDDHWAEEDQLTEDDHWAEEDHLAEEDQLRAQVYRLLAQYLAAAPTQPQLCAAAALTPNQDDADNAMARAYADMATIAGRLTDQQVAREYQDLFIGLGRGELVPFASYYLTGFLNEKPLAELRRRMAELHIARRPEVREPEDHIASLMDMMAGLIRGRFAAPLDLVQQRQFFDAHISPWAGHFFQDLETAKAARFYRPIGTIGRVFMAIETEAFAMIEA